MLIADLADTAVEHRWHNLSAHHGVTTSKHEFRTTATRRNHIRQPLYTPWRCDIVVERIPQHKHCGECGKAILADERYCSEECRLRHETKVQGRKRQLLMLYIGSFIIFVIVIILSFVRL